MGESSRGLFCLENEEPARGWVGSASDDDGRLSCLVLGCLVLVEVGEGSRFTEFGQPFGDLRVPAIQGFDEARFYGSEEHSALDALPAALWISGVVHTFEVEDGVLGQRVVRVLLDEPGDDLKFCGRHYFFAKVFDLLTIFRILGEAISRRVGIK